MPLEWNELERVWTGWFGPASQESGEWRGSDLWLRHPRRSLFEGFQRSVGQPYWGLPWLLLLVVENSCENCAQMDSGRSKFHDSGISRSQQSTYTAFYILEYLEIQFDQCDSREKYSISHNSEMLLTKAAEMLYQLPA